MFSRRKVFVLALGLAFSCAARSAVAAPTFTKGPYLQHLGQTSVTVKVELSEAASADLLVVDSETKKELTAKSGGAGTFHALRVEGLKPGTAYAYTVKAGSADAPSKVDASFKTAPAENVPFRFVAYGDSRSDAKAHASVVRGMEQSSADFLLNTGDMVHKGTNERDWAEFFAIEKDLLRSRCVFAAVGNHELAGGAGGEVAFLKYFAPLPDAPGEPEKPYGTFRWGNTRFFLLNAFDDFVGTERDWIERELDKAMKEEGIVHRMVALHHGPFSSGPHQGNQRLGSVLRSMREHKVDLVIAGHDHLYERGAGAGIKYILTGGAGAPLYEVGPRSPQAQTTESVHHFVEIAVDGEKVKVVAKRAIGTILETCGYTGTGPWECESVAPAKAAATAAPGDPGPDPPKTAPANACACQVAGAPLEAPWAPLGLGAVALGLRAARRRGLP